MVDNKQVSTGVTKVKTIDVEMIDGEIRNNNDQIMRVADFTKDQLDRLIDQFNVEYKPKEMKMTNFERVKKADMKELITMIKNELGGMCRCCTFRDTDNCRFDKRGRTINPDACEKGIEEWLMLDCTCKNCEYDDAISIDIILEKCSDCVRGTVDRIGQDNYEKKTTKLPTL